MSTNDVWQQKRTVYYIFGSFFHNQVGVVSRKNADVFVGTFYDLQSQSKTTIFFDFYTKKINLLLRVKLFIHILTHWKYCFICWLAITRWVVRISFLNEFIYIFFTLNCVAALVCYQNIQILMVRIFLNLYDLNVKCTKI